MVMEGVEVQEEPLESVPEAGDHLVVAGLPDVVEELSAK